MRTDLRVEALEGGGEQREHRETTKRQKEKAEGRMRSLQSDKPVDG